VDSQHVRGARGNYKVLINNYEPTTGPLAGKRIRKIRARQDQNLMGVQETRYTHMVFWSSGLLPSKLETSSPEVQPSTHRFLVCCLVRRASVPIPFRDAHCQ
jgi:hypothetical protein